MLDLARARAEREAPPRIERTYHDARTGYRGYVVVDSLVGGHAHGGVRIRPGLTREELRLAARVMSWKNRYAGVPSGGAKAGIEGAEDLPREEKARRVAWLVEQASDLVDSGLYGIGPDMGTDSGLITQVLEARGLLAGRRAFPKRFRGSGYYTALTTVLAAEAALGLAGERLRGRRVAIEGFGAVGSALAALASERGATVVGISTSGGALLRPAGLDVEGLRRAPTPLEGDPRGERAPTESLLALEVDVLFPCGPGGTIADEQARRLSARVVSPGANAALVGSAEAILHDRGVVAIPSFVANCGGIAAATLRLGGVSEPAIERLFRRHYAPRVGALLARARAAGAAPVDAALSSLSRPRAESDPEASASLLTFLRRVVRWRHVPSFVLAPLTYAYFARRLGAVERTRRCGRAEAAPPRTRAIS